ncbi:MAG TPA: cyclopropane-fatty-acyl-phospholipid synthase family protein [Azonexus sp.]|nr:cyclopropane-fatty-acyl-phospholipid synthase family protein [Azonexus sp.]
MQQNQNAVARVADQPSSEKPFGGSPGAAKTGNQTHVVDQLLLGGMLESLGNPPLKIVLWDGREVAGAGKEPITARPMRLLIRDRSALMRLIADPEINFGEMFVAGRIEVQGDLAEFLEMIYRALPRCKPPGFRERILATLIGKQRNTPKKAARNIYHHYDIGNDFYKLWLDEQMVYTCAYFPDPTLSLESAQVAKMDYVCRKLHLEPGESVVEAGCGWGALALHMARNYGVSVKAYNLSREQIAYARARAKIEGLQAKVEFIEGDYREINNKFDAFVSVGMLEHVGISDYSGLGTIMARCLSQSGRGLIHTIGRDFPHGLNAWIERYIFPGACPPSLSQMMTMFEPHGFSILDVENLRLHYAKTIEHWSQRFEKTADQVTAQFDPAFVRAWRLYLAGSLAAFRSGDMQLFQVVFSRAGCNCIPWSRHDLYAPGVTNGDM